MDLGVEMVRNFQRSEESVKILFHTIFAAFWVFVFYIGPVRGYIALRSCLWTKKHGIYGHDWKKVPWYVKAHARHEEKLF